ncbi:MAG: glycoside hydrolase family 2 protein, partial [Proteiniphilum sp.]|nr:glycoside hydrolase family 2 protein [Proteiniphilum sp.]
MRKTLTMLLPLLSLLAYAQQSETIPLNDGWQFSQMNSDQWYEAEVPGSVQRDLVRHGLLPDPYYGTNEEQVQWVEDENWDFKKTFSVSAAQLQHDEALLLFEGLDTQAEVFLNGSRILRSQNMFVGHEVSVKNLLKEGENKLHIRFYSPIVTMMPARTTFGYDYPAGNDHREEKLSIYNRKAPYHFGWDWGIRIVQMGIWKPISLHFYNDARIEEYYVKQLSVTKEKAEVEYQIAIHSLGVSDATLTYGYLLNGKMLKSEQKEVHLAEGVNNLSIPATITDPHRWMPVNWGEQHLYD